MGATVSLAWGEIGPLLLAAVAIMGSPGPATISLTATGSAHGAQPSIPYLGGIIAGTTIVLLAVAAGITTALLAVPALHSLLIAVSAAYVLRLAYLIATAPPLTAGDAASTTPTLAGGLLLGVANPKAWVAIAAVFASAELSDSATVDGVAKIVVLAIVIVLVNTGWLLAGASLSPLLSEPRRARVFNVAMAVALVAATAYAAIH
jgi:threonine/homoserine/homoserine lactone efflux protein